MNDDRTDLEVFQQCRDLVFGDWTSAAIFVPLRVWIGEKLLHHLLRCYFPAVLGEHRPQGCKQLRSRAGLIWNARKVNRRPTCLLEPTTTSVLRNLQQQFPIGTQPIVKTWRSKSKYYSQKCGPKSPMKKLRILRTLDDPEFSTIRRKIAQWAADNVRTSRT